jgi:hypothetical protein
MQVLAARRVPTPQEMDTLFDAMLKEFGDDPAMSGFVQNLRNSLSAALQDAPSGSGGASTDSNRQCPQRLLGPAMQTDKTAVIGAGGGAIQVRVEIPAGCAWRLSIKPGAPNTWLNIAGPLSGSGPGQVSFSSGPFTPTYDGDDARSVPFDFENLSSPDYSQNFRVAQCSPERSLSSCGTTFTFAQ